MARAAFAETSFLDSAGAVTSPAAEAAGGREVSSSGVMLGCRLGGCFPTGTGKGAVQFRISRVGWGIVWLLTGELFILNVVSVEETLLQMAVLLNL